MRRATASTVGTLGLALAAACTPTANILPSNDFNRPTDIGFMCLGAFDTGGSERQVSGRPMRACHPPPVNMTRQQQPGATVETRTYAFVPNSASGDLSVIDGDTWKIVDLDKATGGFGRAPLGALPEQISVSSDGCRLVSANRGACDVTVVNPSTLLASRFAAEYNSDTVTVTVPPGNGIQHVVPTRDDGTPLGAAPYEVVFLPTDTSALDGANNLCPGDGPGGSWHALATFPGCDLVAILDLPTGQIISSAKVSTDASGKVQLTDAGTHPECLAECGSGRMNGAPDAAAPDPDAGADGGGMGTVSVPARGQFEPTSIAIMPRGDHAYVSLARVPSILSTGLTPTALTTPQNTVVLHENAQGSNRIRLGVDPNQYATAPPDFAGKFVGSPNRSYLYVVARDGSLRIIDVIVPGDPAQEVECETNFDPLDPFDSGRLTPVPITPDTRCIKYGTVKRRQYSGDATAGLRFPTPVIDVAAADMTSTQQEETVNGGYAWVLTASSSIYLVNITPAQRQIKAVVYKSQNTLFPPTPEMCQPQGGMCTGPESCCFGLGCDDKMMMTCQPEGFIYKNADPTPGLVKESPPFPNRPRNRNVMSYSISLDPTLGPPRLDTPPVALLSGPYLEPLYAQGTQDNAIASDPDAIPTFVFFPDREGATAQGWDVAWQGTIVSPRYSGIMHGAVLRDDGGGFCSAGVLPGDTVTLRGCKTKAECPLGMVCHTESSLDQVPGGLTVTGLCVSSNMPSLDSVCAPYVNSVRRYDIVDARERSLTLKPHLDEIVRSTLTPCKIDSAGGAGTGGAGGGGDAGAGGADGGAAGADGGDADGGAGIDHTQCVDPVDTTTSGMNPFRCVDIGLQPRCLMECGPASAGEPEKECRRGRVCLPLVCTSLWDCPSGTTECKNGMCFTDTVCTSQSCGTGRSCIDYGAMEQRCAFDRRSFCADGPPLGPDGCFPQLTSYQVNVNAGFYVTGTASGSFNAGQEGANGCEPIPGRDGRLVSRIPLRPPPNAPLSSIECGADVFTTPTFTNQTTVPAGDGYYFDRFDPRIQPSVLDGKEAPVLFTAVPDSGGMPVAMSARPEAAQLVDWMKAWTKDLSATNACIYLGGPIEGDPPSSPDPTTRKDRTTQHVRARFRNTQVAFLLTNIDRAPAAGKTVHFEVHGGFRQQAVIPVPTIEISAPARLVLGPIDSIPKETANAQAANYFFVVDQRRLGRGQGGGPTRGQIVRVRPFGLASSNGNQPVFEDYTASGGRFPIQ